ncbi:hypothetical protein FACS189411_01220 [Bacteroidia bacterium]|nr:hypothetical protein FACS189411_01220 [Bacteroidia bacterium]
MKNYLSITFLCIVGLSLSLMAYGGDDIPTTGTWGGRDIRSFAPTPPPTAPSASIEGDVLSLYFADAISSLTVTVTTTRGAVAYQAIISSTGGSTYNIPLDVSSGNYQLTLAHSLYGILAEIFNVE